jgi:hypothetical protein
MLTVSLLGLNRREKEGTTLVYIRGSATYCKQYISHTSQQVALDQVLEMSPNLQPCCLLCTRIKHCIRKQNLSISYISISFGFFGARS